MADERSLTVSLEEFGLSKYEAQAYVTLISKGTISAGELAYYSELPRTKVYPTLLKLEKKRLVIISKSKPIMCTAIAPEDAFDSVIDEQINKVNAMNTLVSNLKKASEESRKSRGSEEKRYFHISANNVLDQLRKMIIGSKSSIHIMAEQWGLGLLAECKDQLVGVLRRDLEVKLLIPSSQIGSESFKTIPDGVKIKVSDTIQNCFIFDETEILLIDGDNGKGATFSSTEVLGISQSKLFSSIWKNAVKIDCLADMARTEAQEIYKIIKVINENGLTHLLNSAMISKKQDFDMMKLLEKHGIDLKSKTINEILEIVESSLQIMCTGHLSHNEKSGNITIESKLNSGHSLPWVSLLDSYLRHNGYKTRMAYQGNSQKGEKIHIKIF